MTNNKFTWKKFFDETVFYFVMGLALTLIVYVILNP